MRSQVGFRFDDATDTAGAVDPSHDPVPQQFPGDEGGVPVEEGAGKFTERDRGDVCAGDVGRVHGAARVNQRRPPLGPTPNNRTGSVGLKGTVNSIWFVVASWAGPTGVLTASPVAPLPARGVLRLV